MPSSSKKPVRVRRKPAPGNNLCHSQDGQRLLAVHDIECRRFLWLVGPLALVATGYAVAQTTQTVPAFMQTEAWAIAGVCATACLALHTFIRWKRSLCVALLSQMETLEGGQPPPLSGGRLKRYESLWAMCVSQLTATPDFSLK
jgi:hypothetical protein